MIHESGVTTKQITRIKNELVNKKKQAYKDIPSSVLIP